MTQMMIPLNETDATAPLRVDVHVEAEVIGSEIARRKANVWLLMNAGNLLRADHPRLVMLDKLLWEYDVLLTWPSHGTLGMVGTIQVDAKTGEATADSTLSESIADAADALVKEKGLKKNKKS